jgi:diguanylate cyclase (GGDEF)-like protein/PAS domain S-box-containing protein
VQLRPHISIVRPAVAHSAAVVGVLALLLVVVVLNRAATRSADLEQQIKDRAERFAALLRYAADIICLIDIDGTLIFVSPAVKHVLLYTPEELVGTSVSLLLEPQATQRLLEGVSGFMSSPGVPFQDTVSLLARDGSERIAEITVTNPGGFSPHEVIVNVHDITTQRLLEARLRHDAMHDQLTGLMNRAAVVDAAERAFARASRNGTSVGVLYIDLDGFKAINDTCGHDAGDLVLIEVAARIQRCLRGGEAVGRLGGDEFAIVIEPLTDLHIATEIATRLVDEIGAPITLVPSAQLGASVGIARFPIDGETVEAVFASADEAMYSAKRAGRRQWAMSSHSGAGLKRPRLVG